MFNKTKYFYYTFNLYKNGELISLGSAGIIGEKYFPLLEAIDYRIEDISKNENTKLNNITCQITFYGEISKKDYEKIEDRGQ